MTCSEVRDYLFAFLDNALEPALSIGVQRHLEGCCDCGRDAEIERAVRRALAANLDPREDAPVADPAFDEAAVVRLLRRGRPSLRAESWVLPGAWTHHLYTAGQALVILAGLAAGVRFSTGRGRRSGTSFADLLVSGHEHVAQGGEPVELHSGDPVSVAAWINRRHEWDVKIPAPPDPAAHKLLGARTCFLFGRPAAQAMYEFNGKPVSLVILPSEPGDLKGMGDTGHAGKLAHHFQGHTIVARRRGGMTYAAVGRVPEEQLARLVPDEEAV